MSEADATLSMSLAPSSAAVLRLLQEGALNPVHSFMNAATYGSVLHRRRLLDGSPFPAPVVLPVRDPKAFLPGSDVILRDLQSRPIALLRVDGSFPLEDAGREVTLPLPEEGERYAIFGKLEFFGRKEPPGASEAGTGRGGLEEKLARAGRTRLVAVETDQDLPCRELIRQVRTIAEKRKALALFHCFDPETRPDDLNRYQRLRAATDAISSAFEKNHAVLKVTGLPPASCIETLLLHAVIHRNYGADALVIDHTLLASGVQATTFVERCRADYGIDVMAVRPPRRRRTKLPAGRQSRGVCIWLTGLSGAGKSTIAENLAVQLMDQGRKVTLLDGDVVRTHLSKGLSFSKEDRHLNICRIGFVASEIVRHNGIAICAAVSPYQSSRATVRKMMPEGSFVEVFVDTPLAMCEMRDAKGFYAQARSGQVSSFTGISAPYEEPANPELRIDGMLDGPQAKAERVMQYLRERGYLSGSRQRSRE